MPESKRHSSPEPGSEKESHPCNETCDVDAEKVRAFAERFLENNENNPDKDEEDLTICLVCELFREQFYKALEDLGVDEEKITSIQDTFDGAYSAGRIDQSES